MSKRTVLPSPRATTTRPLAADWVDREEVKFHAERIQAAAKVLDDVQRAHIYTGEDEALQQEILRDAPTLLLLEESAALVTTARDGGDRKAEEGFALTVEQAAETWLRMQVAGRAWRRPVDRTS
jgi:hypothetical protein